MAILAFNIGQAQAQIQVTTLSSSINVDNMFNEYISSSATDLTGAQLIQSQLWDTNGGALAWATTFNASTSITGTAPQYLIVEAINVGGPGGFLGSFSLSGSQYEFSNHSQSLLTGDAAWTQSTNGVAGSYANTIDQGQNGVGPWGSRGGNNPLAHWVTGGGAEWSTTYYSASINQVAAVPEPEEWALMIVGLGLIGFKLRNRKTESQDYESLVAC